MQLSDVCRRCIGVDALHLWLQTMEVLGAAHQLRERVRTCAGGKKLSCSRAS